MKKEGGCEWYQSMGLIILYISANFLLFFKGPRPFKSQKTNFSGLTTQYAPRLNRGPSAANISWPTTAIKNLRNTVHSSFCRFFDTYSQRKTYEVPTRYRADTWKDSVKSTQKFLIF